MWKTQKCDRQMDKAIPTFLLNSIGGGQNQKCEEEWH